MRFENFLSLKGELGLLLAENLEILMEMPLAKNLAPWHIIKYKSNPNCAWQIWKSTFQNISDAHAPVRKRKIRINHSPWLTPELKKLMFERDNLKKTATNNKTSDNWLKYKLTRNKVNDSIKCADRNKFKLHTQRDHRSAYYRWSGFGST